MDSTERIVLTQPAAEERVCAVVTTYRPAASLIENVRLIGVQVSLVIIVDDSGTDGDFSRLQSWFGGSRRVELIKQEANLGQAAALNRGLAAAFRKGYLWALALDDDSSVEPDIVRSLTGSWRAVSGDGGKPVAVMGISYRDSRTGFAEPEPADGVRFLEKRGVITSGSLISLDIYRQIGPFREEFFIDFVDYDFCLRARDKGYRIVKLSRFGMTHSLGYQTRRRIGWFFVETTNHAPLRRYYMYRNSMILAREQFLRDPLFSLAVVFFSLKTVLLVLFFEKNRYYKIRMMWRGIIDAFSRRMGKCPWNY